MTVQELVDFISKYGADTPVTMLQCSDDNPVTEDVLIDVVAIERANGALSIVIIPEL